MYRCSYIRAGIEGIRRYAKYTLIRFFEKWYTLLLASLISEMSLYVDRFT